jgi:NadR type nicotinamide-nucleotide adenylyltransferase
VTTFRLGLVVGKFSPLHRGHQLLVQRALAACDDVVVVSYANPERPGCHADRRATWLRLLFPRAHRLVVTSQDLAGWGWPSPLPHDDDDETTHRRFVGRLCTDVLRRAPDAVFTSEDYGDGFAAELTRCLRARWPDAPEVRHVCVDRERTAVPVSGTLVRANVHAHRSWLSPQVYASFVRRVCILGGESTGKSTLATALAQRLGTTVAEEYGRELWVERDGKLAYTDLLTIAQNQVAREEALLGHAHRWLVCDTSPLTTLLYSLHLFQRADPVLVTLSARSYDATLLCGLDVPYVQDGTRQEEPFREWQHRWYLDELHRRHVPFTALSGPLGQRVDRAVALLGGMDS